MIPNEETEFWRDYKSRQAARREKREDAFKTALPEFKRDIEAMGLTLHSPGAYHYQIKRGGKLVADYWPRPHHKYRFGDKYKNARNSGDFLARLRKFADTGRGA